MNKIKLKKRTWTNKDGRKGASYRFFYNENGNKRYLQSPNKKWLETEAAKILFKLDNVRSEIPLPLEDTWEAYYKESKGRMYENKFYHSPTLFSFCEDSR